MSDAEIIRMIETYHYSHEYLCQFGKEWDLFKYVSHDVHILMYDGLRVPIANALDSVKVNLKNSWQL